MNFIRHNILHFLIIVLIMSLMVITYKRNIVWQNEVVILKDAISKGSEKVRLYNNLGAALFTQGRFEESISAYEAALKLQPDQLEAHIGIGIACVSQGLYEKAWQHYQRALELKPSAALRASIHYHLGLMFLVPQIEDEERALREFEIALEYAPNDRLARMMLNYLSNSK